ncbi:MAG: shikimate dehydrogenase [Candidatus Hydrogenedentes bacterium]|nr:shikimate dehydrogenase [Candidatus Hydrogenedentota bacterium]
MHPIDTDTQLCGVIGNPVGHSLSPRIHNAAYDAAGLNFVYLAFEISDVGGCLTGLRAMPNFRGLSVTIPHKLAVMEYLDELEPMAEKVGSVNTVTKEGGRLIGSTTDGPGAIRAFDEAGISLVGRRVLFLGAGGAVRAVAFAVAELCSPGGVTILGRNPERVGALVEDLRATASGTFEPGDLSGDIEKAMSCHDVIIQGTPVGMAPEGAGETCVPRETLRPEQVVFDMVYTPRRTRLIADAEAVGCTVVYGIEMLLNQAALQFERWTGKSAPLAAMRASVSA